MHIDLSNYYNFALLSELYIYHVRIIWSLYNATREFKILIIFFIDLSSTTDTFDSLDV